MTTWRTNVPLILLSLLLLSWIHVFAQSYGDDEQLHALQHQTLCVDAHAVMLVFENVGNSRVDAVQPVMVQTLSNSLKNALREAGVTADFPETCPNTQGYTAIFLRVSLLDEGSYARYGENAFGYALGVQVGTKADRSYLVDHNILPDLQFMAFEEDIASEDGPNALLFDQYLITRAEVVIHQLVEAWKAANP